jgi:hypothetical protein
MMKATSGLPTLGPFLADFVEKHCGSASTSSAGGVFRDFWGFLILSGVAAKRSVHLALFTQRA